LAEVAPNKTKKKRPPKDVVLPPVRTSLDELELARSYAEEAGLTFSEYVRRRILYQPTTDSQAVRLDAQLLSELNRLSVSIRSGVGNSLNQLVKDWNSGADARINWHETKSLMDDAVRDLHALMLMIADTLNLQLLSQLQTNRATFEAILTPEFRQSLEALAQGKDKNALPSPEDWEFLLKQLTDAAGMTNSVLSRIEEDPEE